MIVGLEKFTEGQQHTGMMLNAIRDVSAQAKGVRAPGRVLFLLVFLGYAAVGCGDNGPTEVSLRFGQVGEITVTVRAPLLVGEEAGELQQILTWGSTGPWVLKELISYRGR